MVNGRIVVVRSRVIELQREVLFNGPVIKAGNYERQQQMAAILQGSPITQWATGHESR